MGNIYCHAVSDLYLEIIRPFGGINSQSFRAFLKKQKLKTKERKSRDFRLPPLSG
jgi:hypothetical protein